LECWGNGSKSAFPKKSVGKRGKEKVNSHTGIIPAVTEIIHTAAEIVAALKEMTHAIIEIIHTAMEIIPPTILTNQTCR